MNLKIDIDRKFDNVNAQIQKLSSQLQILQAGQRNQSRNGRSRSRPRSDSPAGNNSNSNLCYYHNKFGERAFKCIQPCSFQSTENI